MLKAAYTLAATLDKRQLRLVRLQPSVGVMSYFSPTSVAQWFAEHWMQEGDDTDIEVADIKRAISYRTSKLIAIGATAGKINFAFDDGAFLRTDKYDGESYDAEELSTVFTFDEESYAWPLGNGQPMQALVEMIAAGDATSNSDGEMFFPSFPSRENGKPMPLLCAPGFFFPKVTNILLEWAESVQPSSAKENENSRKLGFYGRGYRAVTAMTAAS
jgi:hypothetical protein